MGDDAGDLAKKIESSLTDAHATAGAIEAEDSKDGPASPEKSGTSRRDPDGTPSKEEDDVLNDLKTRAKKQPQVSPVKHMRKGGKASQSSPHMGSGGRVAAAGSHHDHDARDPSRGPPAQRMKRAATASGSFRKKKGLSKSGSFAGYQAPDQAVDASAIGEAKNVMRDSAALGKILQNKNTIVACRSVGINPEDLIPRPKSSFKTEPNRAEVLPKDKQQRRFDHFENRRLWKLAVVLTAAQEAEKKKKDEEVKKHHLGDELFSVFNQALDGERKRNKKIHGDRSKIENVLIKENELLIQRRKEFEERESKMEERHRKIAEQRIRQKQELHDKAVARQKEIDRLQQKKNLRAAAKVVNAVNAFQARDQRVKHYLDQKLGAAGEKRREKEKQNKKREEIRKEGKARDNAGRADLERKLEEKSSRADIIRHQREREMEQKKEEKKLQAASRQDNAARVRKMQQAQRNKGADKMRAAYLRMELQRELREAIVDDRRAKKKEQIIEIDHWKETTKLERAVTPGPGEYHVDSGPGSAGGTWGKHNPKTELEWQIYRASQIPGPGEYVLPSSMTLTGGTWGKHKPKSDVEWQMYRASQIPGPGAYQPRALRSGVAVKFGDHDPPSELDLQMRRAANTPGPGAYSGAVLPLQKRKLKEIQKSLKVLAKEIEKDDDLPTKLPDPSPMRKRPSTRG